MRSTPQPANHPAYDFVIQHNLDEYRSTGLLYRHRATGAEVYHVANEDVENLFAFAFKTLPADSTGIAHILEHTVLCGSQTFPLKDPFLLLLKGSMSTFLNAYTFPDKTVYPASSTVEKDLFNIMRVYGDAVFFPLLKPEMFRQEGHRLQFDSDGKLEITGVVYNEMKGAYSTHDSIASEWAYRSLFPDTLYAHDSGGDPRFIPQLTYDAFVAFHRTYYHPSNTRVFLYGNIPTERTLDFLHETFFARFERLSIDAPVPAQPRWDAPREMRRTFPVDGPTANDSSVTLNWLLCPIDRQPDVLALEILTEILLGHSGSPLEKVIVESDLGDDLSSPTGIETELYELVFSVGMRGTEASNQGAIEELVLGELRRLRDNGIPSDLVTAALRKVEFRNREIRGGGPYGLRLMRRALRGWLHGGSPEVTLRFAEPFAQLKAAIGADPRFFEKLIDRYLLQNPHRTTLVVTPDQDQGTREQEELSRHISEIERGLDDEGRARIGQDQQELAAYQEGVDTPDDVARIPFLERSDVPRELERIPFERQTVGDEIDLYAHEVFTNGITYLDLAFSLDDLPPELLPAVPFFTAVVNECGLPGVSYDELATRLALHTGGFSARPEVGCHADNPDRVVPMLFFRLRALDDALPEAVDLVSRILNEADFTNLRRIQEVLTEARNDMRSSVIPAGHAYSMTRAASLLSATAAVEEQWKGISQLLSIAGHDDATAPRRMADALEAVRTHVLGRNRLTMAVTADTTALDRAAAAAAQIAAALPVGPARTALVPLQGRRSALNRRTEALVVPAGVNYVARAMRGSPIGTPEQTAEVILGHLMSTGYLWEEIRMKGGAYGAFSSSRGAEQVFVFGSYRDPNITATLQRYHAALEHFAQTPVGTRELDLAVLGTVGGELRPLAPAERGLVSFKRILYRVSEQIRQAKRDAMIGITPDQVQRAAQRLLAAEAEAAVVVMGTRESLSEAATEIPELMDAPLDLPV